MTASKGHPHPTTPVLIVGGGIAGLACSIRLSQLGVPHLITERESSRARKGHGFILVKEGIELLKSMGAWAAIAPRGQKLSEFLLKRPDGSLVMTTPLENSMGFRRAEFISALENLLPPQTLSFNSQFTHFEWTPSGRVTRSHFADGSSIAADIFIASDGARSRIRSTIFPQSQLEPGQVKELVCHIKSPALAATLKESFVKYQKKEGKIAFGLVPCGQDEVIWYLQFDSSEFQLEEDCAAAKRVFAVNLVGNWCHPIPEILAETDFEMAHLWNTADLDPLPSLHHENVVLIGDAAHAFLPFTSQGVNAALRDVEVLINKLRTTLTSEKISTPLPGQPLQLEAALEAYSRERLPDISRITSSGRGLRTRFLDPGRFAGEEVLPISK